MGDWTESLHPRATDGKFGQGNGNARGAKAQATLRAVRSAGGIKAVRPTKVKAVRPPKPPKFDPTEHQNRIAGLRTREAKIRTAGLAAKAQMASLKLQAKSAKAKGASKDQLGALKAQHDALKGHHASIRALAATTKTERVQAGKDMRQAKQDHNLAHGIGRAKPKPKAAVTATQQPSAPAPVGKTATAQAAAPVRASVAKPAESAASAGAAKLGRLVASDAGRRALIAAPMTGDYKGTPQWSVEAQSALRDHHDLILKDYGLHNQDINKPQGRSVLSSDRMTISGHQTYGSHSMESGDIHLWDTVAKYVQKHAQLDESGLADLGRRAQSGDKEAIRTIDAYRVSTHEALHGHGPPVFGGSRNGTYFDEVTTELAARKVAGDVHGIPAFQIPGSYDRYIKPTVDAVAKMSGKSPEAAYNALTEASLDWKRQTPIMANGRETEAWGSEHLQKMIATTLTKLGVPDTKKHEDLYKQIDDFDHGIDSDRSGKYNAAHPSTNRYK